MEEGLGANCATRFDMSTTKIHGCTCILLASAVGSPYLLLLFARAVRHPGVYLACI